MSRTYHELECGCLISCENGGGLIPCSYFEENPNCKAKEYIDKHKCCEICGECIICYDHENCKIRKENKNEKTSINR